MTGASGLEGTRERGLSALRAHSIVSQFPFGTGPIRAGFHSMTDARAFHDGLVVVDGLEYSNWDRELFLELKSGGVTAVHATVVYWEDARQTLALLADWNRRFQEHGDLIRPVRAAAEDIRAAKR